MKTKTAIICVSSVLTLGLVAATIANVVVNQGQSLIKAGRTEYTVTLNADNSPDNLPTEYSATEITAVPDRYANMGYVNAKKGTGQHAVLKAGAGELYNITGIDVNIVSLTAVFSGGDLTLKAGYKDTTDWSMALTSGTPATFEGNYFMVEASGSTDVTLTSLSYTYTCSEIVAPTNEVSNLAVAFSAGDYDTEGIFTVSFDSYSGATKYMGALYRGTTLVEKKAISSGDTFAAVKQSTATNEAYSFNLTAYDGTNHKALTKATAATMNVYYRNAFNDGTLTWNAYVVDNAPFGDAKMVFNDSSCSYIGGFNSAWQYNGTGTFAWPNGQTVVSSNWVAGNPGEAKLTYDTGMNYVGTINSALNPDGNGIFSWSTTGEYSGGNAWKGHWTNGTWDLGVAGTFYYPANWTHPYDGMLHYIDCKESEVGTPDFSTVTGGKYMWGADDAYVGAMTVTANNAFTRVGLGHQYNPTMPLYTAGDWHTSTFNDGTHANLVAQLDTLSATYGTLRCGGFYGTFISSTNWISGDGCNVFYANDGVTPVAYITGTYSGGTTRTGAYTTKVVMPGFESATDLTSYWQ